MFLTTVASILVLLAVGAAEDRPSAVAVVFSGTGDYDWGMYDVDMTLKWKAGLEGKLDDPAWPVNASVEMVDYNSNTTYLVEWAARRITQNPPVSVFIFPTVGITLMPQFYRFGVPCILALYSANKYNENVNPGPEWNYTFFNLPPVQYYYKELTQLWKQVGVKTMVVFIDLSDAAFSYDKQSCERAARDLLVPNGIANLKTFEYDFYTTPVSTLESYVRETAELDPDAVLACVIGGQGDATLHPWLGQVMKNVNYLPKAMNVIDTSGTSAAKLYIEQETLIYMTQPTFGHPKLSGIDYTNADAPYSSYFLGSKVRTVADALLSGSNLDDEHLSSTRLFYDWFVETTGTRPQYYSNIIWSAFDCVEAAFYHAAVSRALVDPSIASIGGEEMQAALMASRAATPFGRVIYDFNRVNTQASAVLLQWTDNTENTEIIVPSTVATHDFIYPMPTWDERTYEWSLMKGEAKGGIAVGAACTFLLTAIAITMVVYRQAVTIKVLNHIHMCALQLSCTVVVWGLVFVWQADVNQAQCDAFLWVIFLPGSFAVQLINMKAYRLSVFLTSESDKKKKLFTHNRVLILTLYWVSFTFLVLIICQFADPPTKTTIVIDDYRPSLDYNICRFGDVTHGLLTMLVVGHMVMSACCVIYVRNGMESFQDGMIMKEAFMILFALIIVAFIFGNLDVTPSTFYLLRTLFVGLGFTLFSFRLLMSRCLVRWLPQPVAICIVRAYKTAKIYMPATTAFSAVSEANGGRERNASSIAMMAGEEEIGKDVVNDDHLAELWNVFDDPKRLELLSDVAKKSYVSENVEFLHQLHKLPGTYAAAAIEHSVESSKGVEKVAMGLFEEFCAAGANKEVNISDRVRQRLKKAIESIPQQRAFLSQKMAEAAVDDDNLEVKQLFNDAGKEVKLMLYQNVWAKFRTAETEADMV